MFNENQTFLHFEFSNQYFQLLVKSKYISPEMKFFAPSTYANTGIQTQKVEKLSLDLIFIDISLKKYQMFYQTKLHVKNLLITRQKLTRTNNVHWSYWRTSSGTLFCILKSKTTNICCSAFSISFIFELRQFHFYIVVQVIEFSREGYKIRNIFAYLNPPVPNSWQEAVKILSFLHDA